MPCSGEGGFVVYFLGFFELFYIAYIGYIEHSHSHDMCVYVYVCVCVHCGRVVTGTDSSRGGAVIALAFCLCVLRLHQSRGRRRCSCWLLLAYRPGPRCFFIHTHTVLHHHQFYSKDRFSQTLYRRQRTRNDTRVHAQDDSFRPAESPDVSCPWASAHHQKTTVIPQFANFEPHVAHG